MIRTAVIVAVAVAAACGPKSARPPSRPASAFAAGPATLRVAITELPTTTRGRRQTVSVIVRDAAGAEHAIHRAIVEGSCALRAGHRDLEADAAVIAAIECAAGGRTEVHVRITLDADAVTVAGGDGERRLPTPESFALRAE